MLVGWCATVALAWPRSSGAGSAIEGEIRGVVMTRTAPIHVVAHQAIHLTIIERGASSERAAVTDAEGSFRFPGLPVGGIRVFVLSTVYAGVQYASDRVALSPATPLRTVAVVVYESSRDRSRLRSPLVLAVVDVARGALRASIVQRLENPSDRTILVTPQDPLVFPLPPGAESVTFLAGWRDPRVAGGRITDAFPLLPGRTEVAYSYGLEAPRSEVMVPWTLPYGAGEVELLISNAGVGVAAAGLTAQGAVEGPHGRFRRFSGGPMAPGRQLVLRLRGVPRASDPWPGAVAAGLALCLACGLALSLRRTRPCGSAPGGSPVAAGAQHRGGD